MKRLALGLALFLGHAALPGAASADDLFGHVDRMSGGGVLQDLVHRGDWDRHDDDCGRDDDDDDRGRGGDEDDDRDWGDDDDGDDD